MSYRISYFISYCVIFRVVPCRSALGCGPASQPGAEYRDGWAGWADDPVFKPLYIMFLARCIAF